MLNAIDSIHHHLLSVCCILSWINWRQKEFFSRLVKVVVQRGLPHIQISVNDKHEPEVLAAL
jgi:hypothetical protein